MKKIVVICPDEETKQAVFNTFGRLSSMMGLMDGFTQFIGSQDDTRPEAELAAIIGPAVMSFAINFQKIYLGRDILETDLHTLQNVYDNLQFRKDG